MYEYKNHRAFVFTEAGIQTMLAMRDLAQRGFMGHYGVSGLPRGDEVPQGSHGPVEGVGAASRVREVGRVKNKKPVRECYWCGALRVDHRRITLSGPAARRVYVCRGEVCEKSK